jgi:hypothetical protein
MALDRIPIPSPNYSSRGGASVRLLVLHTAEGSRTIESLGSYFANPSSGVSSHAGADDKSNAIGVFVRRADKAWTAANANPVAVQIEACAFAAWDNAEWSRHPNMLNNIGHWLAEEAAAFGVPLVKLTPAEAQGDGRGVCQHRDLGAWGGSHHDCGDGFPIDLVLELARGATPSPPVGERKGAVQLRHTSAGYYIFAADGGVFAYGNALMYGSIPGLGVKLAAPIVGGAVTRSERGYWLVGEDGGVFSFGDAQFDGSMGGTKMNAPVVGIEADPDGEGYWLLGADGGVFAFDAPFYGSAVGKVSGG